MLLINKLYRCLCLFFEKVSPKGQFIKKKITTRFINHSNILMIIINLDYYDK